jgi:hypothetical protein
VRTKLDIYVLITVLEDATIHDVLMVYNKLARYDFIGVHWDEGDKKSLGFIIQFIMWIYLTITTASVV